MSLKGDTCCGCVELRIGCLILGYLSLIGHLIFLYVVFIPLEIAFGSTDTVSIQYTSLEAVLLYAVIAYTLVTLIFTILFLIGLHSNKHQYVKCFLIFTLITAMINFTVHLISMVNAESVTYEMIGLFILYTALQIYYLIVIRSYYYKMKTEEFGEKLIGCKA